jgi:phosphocarrier protein HPr
MAEQERDLTIVNDEGLHARPAAMFVKTSNRYSSEVWISKEGEQVNGKSILGVMMLAAEQGAVITVTADGEDAEAALDAIEALVAGGFAGVDA